jgi:hypothetical protein
VLIDGKERQHHRRAVHTHLPHTPNPHPGTVPPELELIDPTGIIRAAGFPDTPFSAEDSYKQSLTSC